MYEPAAVKYLYSFTIFLNGIISYVKLHITIVYVNA